ncbi:hypothetical protein TNCV_4907361 [Trichonephila clavipes]|uniref:Uncharacterized protein n=1 Tax=Trichonephila clavipes TaxID=2585209 RepID=A0A8X6V7T4_TRICX|nr:hypothetical protein TNCV_4907361 [Trichonephila clavipes]
MARFQSPLWTHTRGHMCCDPFDCSSTSKASLAPPWTSLVQTEITIRYGRRVRFRIHGFRRGVMWHPCGCKSLSFPNHLTHFFIESWKKSPLVRTLPQVRLNSWGSQHAIQITPDMLDCGQIWGSGRQRKGSNIAETVL